MMLSSARVQSAPAGATVRLRSGRGPRALFAAHAADCAQCRSYMEDLVAARDQIAEWDGRLTFVVAGPLESAIALRASLAHHVEVLADPEHALGLAGGTLVVADEWGEEHFTTTTDESHALPDAAEVVDWVRFTAIQCEECERPEGEWRTL